MVEMNAFLVLAHTFLSFRVQSGDGRLWKRTIACYGSDDRCSMYKMDCGPHMVIEVGPMVYGTKQYALDTCTYGTADCVKTNLICCSFNETDMFTIFSEFNRTSISKHCNGNESCSGFAPRLARNPFSSYVVMNYSCVNATSAGSTSDNCGQFSTCKTTTRKTAFSHRLSSLPFPLTTTQQSLTSSLSSSSDMHVGFPVRSTTKTSIRTPLQSIKLSKGTQTSAILNVTTISPLPSWSSTLSFNTDRASPTVVTTRLFVKTGWKVSSSRQSSGFSRAATLTTPTSRTITLKANRTNSTPLVIPGLTVIKLTESTSTMGNEVKIENGDNDGMDKGPIVGLIIGILVALALIVAIIIWLCIRIKHKQRLKQNYIRNTNIFYSFPDDLKDTGSNLSDCKSVETIEQDDTLVIQTNELYTPFDANESTYQDYLELNIDNYIIRVDKPGNEVDVQQQIENEHFSENAIKNDSSVVIKENGDNLETSSTKGVKPGPSGQQRVHFDPSTLYASVSKEGKTKF